MLMVAIRYGRFFAKQVDSISEAESLSDSGYCAISGIYDGHILLDGKGIEHYISVLNDLIAKASLPEPEWVYVQYGRYMPKDEGKEYRPYLGLYREQLAQLLKIKVDNNL